MIVQLDVESAAGLAATCYATFTPGIVATGAVDPYLVALRGHQITGSSLV